MESVPQPDVLFGLDYRCVYRSSGRKWAGKPFWLLPWQEQIIRDVFGVVREDGTRQFRTAYVEIPKKNGKQLDIDTLIPTPDGFTRMGDLKVGDVVFDENGKPCRVVAKSEIDDTEQAYWLTFRDGSSIITVCRYERKSSSNAPSVRFPPIVALVAAAEQCGYFPLFPGLHHCSKLCLFYLRNLLYYTHKKQPVEKVCLLADFFDRLRAPSLAGGLFHATRWSC